MNETHEHFNYVHNVQVQVHPHNHPLGEMRSTQNAVSHKNARATTHVPGPSNIMLLTHIRFLNGLRSTASPILSHFHTLVCLTLVAPITVWIQFLSATQCLNLEFPLEHCSLHNFHPVQFQSLHPCSCLVIGTRTGREPFT